MAERPNFLIVVSDQHAPDAIGALGDGSAITPALDGLAARGVSFRDAYCAYPMCTPSRASFMTGQLTPETGVWELGSPLRSDLPTWAHVLRRGGYTTSLCGRMHFVGHDKKHGFERVVHGDLKELLVPSVYGDWDRPVRDDHVMVKAVRAAGPSDQLTKTQRFDVDVMQAAVAELRHLTQGGGVQPWALTVGLIMPHFPYTVSREYYDRCAASRIAPPRRPPEGSQYEPYMPAQMRDLRRWLGLSDDGLTDAEIHEARRCYYGMIHHMDELVGGLLDELERSGAADNTWVVYLSDHGDNIGEHGFWSKMNFYEESVRVPLIIAPPGCAHGGASCRAPVSLVDWMSTVADMVGDGDAAGPLPGRSLLPLLEDPLQRWDDRVILSDYACEGTRMPMRMVRRGNWKASFAEGFPPMLFDLESDPHEWRDLGSVPASAPLLRELHGVAYAEGGLTPAQLREHITQHKRRLKLINAAERPAGGV